MFYFKVDLYRKNDLQMEIPKQLADVTRYDHNYDELVVSDNGGSLTVDGVTRMWSGFYI